MGWKQWNKAYLRVMEFCGKPALFSQNPAEDGPIESSHAGGHWFESSSLHQSPWNLNDFKGFFFYLQENLTA